MKLAFYSRCEQLGTAETQADGTLVFSGPNEEAVRGIVEYYAVTTDLTGNDLLKHILRRVRGQTIAVLVSAPTRPSSPA